MQKENLKQMEAQEEQRLIRCQKDYLEVEVRKFKRKKLLSYHIFEQELLREVRQYYFAKIDSYSRVIMYIFTFNYCVSF